MSHFGMVSRLDSLPITVILLRMRRGLKKARLSVVLSVPGAIPVEEWHMLVGESCMISILSSH